MRGPYLPNLEPILAAGINPETGLPYRISDQDCGYKEGIRKQLRVLDEQDAVNRYVWYNLPMDLQSQEVERMLYYRGQLAFFYFKEKEEFYFMPYALDGGIDFYGRFNSIHPVPMAEGVTDEEKKALAMQRNLLSMKKLKCVYDIHSDELKEEDLYDSCVLLRDYTNQLSQTVIPRQQLNDPLLGIMANCIPYMNTALKNSTGVQGIRTNNQDEQSNVNAANETIDKAALNGRKYVGITGSLDFQDLAGGQVAKAEEFMMAMQSLDNFRLSTYGLDNGGLYSKKAYVNQDTQSAMTGGLASAPLQDGLTIRQHFCDIVNSIWGLGIWCEIAESALGADRNMDGVVEETETNSEEVDYE